MTAYTTFSASPVTAIHGRAPHIAQALSVAPSPLVFRSFDRGVLLKRLVTEGTSLKPDEPVAIIGDAGEDVANDVQKTEERYSTIPSGGTTAMVAADQLYKSGVGYVKGITCYSDATATAGTIALLDNTSAGAGNVLWSFDVLAVAYNTPFTVDLQTPFAVGLFLDFTTTADVKCMVRYR